jgi:hypothetical protein
MDYARQLGLYVMLGLEARAAPAWFADTAHPDAVFVTYDPDPAAHPDMVSGRLAAAGELSLPIFYHPDFYLEVDKFYEAAVARYKSHSALLAWELCIFFTGEYNYPGGYTYDVAGFADYSAYTETLYGKTPPYPLIEFSQEGPDARADWAEWTRFRLLKKREALDHFSVKLKSLDPDHVVIAWPCGSPLWGELGNGLFAEAHGNDWLYMMSCPNIDVIRVAPQVSVNLFEVVSGEMSLIPYLMQPTIRAARANGKAFMLQTEREVGTSDLSAKIVAWTCMAKACGVQHFLWWQEPLDNPVSGQWTAAEKAQITAMEDIIALPDVDKFSTADFAFLDMSFEWGKYYADNTFSVMYAMKQVKAFMDAGLPFECVSEDEINADPSVLDGYKAIGLLHPDSYNLLAPGELKTAVTGFQAGGGALWNGDPLDGFLYCTSGYDNATYPFPDSLRAYYDANSLNRHDFNGYGVQIIANRPYVFLLSRAADFSGTITVSVSGWDLPDGAIELADTSGASYSAVVSGGFLQIDLNLSEDSPFLLKLK